MFKIYGKMFFKSFFLQALWNFERLQNIGFLFVLKPFVDKVYPDRERRKEALIRHTGFFQHASLYGEYNNCDNRKCRKRNIRK